uniref:pentatricopeptide repeat-containing protein At4g33990-like n=1 Tax=Erigeron canadensis TaxID=72917 RepID=UPI001CB8DC19|nr:pentatricopeptide repeat-containing protein At4g33990-like [Erigeron canadensis]
MLRRGLNTYKTNNNNTISKIETYFDTFLKSCKNITILKQIHSILTTNGLIKQSVHLGAKIIIKYSDFSHIKEARLVFNQTHHASSSFLWNTMLRAYANNGFCKEALLFYRLMRKNGLKANNFTYPFVLKSCGSDYMFCEFGKLVHCEVIRNGFGSDVYVEAALVDMYSGCGLLEDGRKVFDKMRYKDVVCWTAMITAYEQAEKGEIALYLLHEMQEEGLVLDWVTIVTVASAVGQLGDVKRARAVHGFAIRNEVLKEVPVVNSVIGMYGKCGEVEYAEMVFEYKKERNCITWNSMLTCYTQNGLASEALCLFEKMKVSDVVPNEVTVLVIVSACAYLGSRQNATKIHDFIVQHDMEINLTLWNAIIDMYAKCADLDTALKMFQEVSRDRLHVSSWNTLIAGYGIHGFGKEAVRLFKEMKNENISPNHITFTSILSACSHAGLVDEGKECFAEMEKFEVTPEPKHYACMVDMLGRAGQLNEAYELIKSMSSKPNDEVWGALLLACKMYGNTNLAKIAADNLFHLEPQHSGYYVLMSNIYADSQNWQEVGKLRQDMKDRGLRKPAALSLIEFNQELHGFHTGEQLDSFTRDVYKKVEQMVIELKMAGYVPDFSCVFHDVEDEDKYGMLNYHGEKLALAFGLKNIDTELSIRITKNLRVCSDCHSAFKLVSRVYGRRIILRDVNRFHHFEDGLCSCNDYW